MAKKLTRYILIALVVGIVAGWAINAAIDDGTPASAERLKSVADYLSIVTALFLRLIKMIIAPLVFSTLVAGIAHMGDVAALGRVALTAVGEKGAPIVRGVEALVKVMLQVTDYVMRFAPFAVFTAVASAITERGPSIIATFGKFVGSFYLGLIVLWAFLIGAAFLIVGPRTRHLVRYIRDPVVLAFSTASSEAAYPRTLEELERFGVPPRIASFVLPLGYSFNLDGSMMYMTFATIFIAQAYGIHLSLGQEFTMLLVLMITSKGMAGVPRASLVVIAATMSMFRIPEAGLLLILAVDHFLDMGH